MINSVVAYGCSNTYGDEAIADYNLNIDQKDNIYYAYPWYIAQKIKCNKDNYYNYAKVGTCNQEIATTVLNTITNHDPKTTLVIIGWTDDNRFSVTTNTEYSRITLKRLYDRLPWKLKLQTATKYKQLLDRKNNTKKVTITQSLIRLIYLKLLGLNETSFNNILINNDYYTKNIKPYFSNEFILGIEKHIFNTENNTNANLLYKKAVDSFLQENNYNYFMFTTKFVSDRKFLNFVNKNNYYDWKEHDNFISIIHEFGTKYGMSASNTHMKYYAHQELAEHLFQIIKNRHLLNE